MQGINHSSTLKFWLSIRTVFSMNIYRSVVSWNFPTVTTNFLREASNSSSKNLPLAPYQMRVCVNTHNGRYSPHLFHDFHIYIYIYGFWRTFNLYQPKVRFIFYANNLDTCNLKEYIKLMLANLLFSFSSFWKKVPNSLLITLMRELLLKNIFLAYSNKPTECCRTSHSQQTVFSGKSKLEFLVELIKACKSDNSMLFNLWITWEVKWKGIMEICNSHFFLIKTKLHVFVHTQKWKIHFYSFFQAYKISEKPRPCDWESLNCWE